MADEQKPKERKKPKEDKKLIEPENKGSILTTTGKAVGTPAGKMASLAGVSEPAPTLLLTKSTKHPKLQKKNKSRLPRRQKKAQRKVAATRGEG